MKAAIGILLVLGVVAAACAAFLVSGFSLNSEQTRAAAANALANPTVTVLYITRTVPAMTVVDGGLIESKQCCYRQRARGLCGQLYRCAGQGAFQAADCGRGIHQSLFCGDDWRQAVGGRYSGGQASGGNFGCRLFRIGRFDLPGQHGGCNGLIQRRWIVYENHRDAVTATLVENVQVLAFEQQSVVSAGKSLTDIDAAHTGTTRRVTLLVDTKRSKALELGDAAGDSVTGACATLWMRAMPTRSRYRCAA